MPRVALRRWLLPVLPARAATNSGRVAWFSILAGSDSESASTLPEASIMVTRAPAACDSSAAISGRDWPRAVSTRRASRRVFWVRLRSISVRREASQALPSMRSRVTAVAAIAIRKAASSLKKMRFFTFASFGDLETVTGAADRFEVARVLGVRLDFFPDTADVDINGTGSHIRSVAPDGVEQMVAREDTSAMAGKVIEQAELRGGGGNQLAADHEGHRRGINLNLTDLQGTGREGPLEAAQHGLDAGHELARAEGLGDVVVGAELESENAVGFTALGGQKNDGHGGEAGSLANRTADFEAVFARNHDVENEQRGTLAFGVGQNIDSGGIDAHIETFVLKMMANEAGNIGIVFHNKDAGFHRIIVNGKQLPGTSCEFSGRGSDSIFIEL